VRKKKKDAISLWSGQTSNTLPAFGTPHKRLNILNKQNAKKSVKNSYKQTESDTA
jgi:hypothetical protein